MPDTVDDDYDIDMRYSDETFPNGLPRVYDGCVSMVEGIPHFWYGGALQPSFTDYRLVVEMRHKLVGYHYPSESVWGEPIEMRYMSDYCASNQEAFDHAWQEQKELEAKGHFVPIEIRD